MPVVVAVPVKSFAGAKARLAGAIEPKERSSIGRALASRTVSVVKATGAIPLVVAGDGDVADWASTEGIATTVSPPGLDAAAAAAVRWAGFRPWVILHADLPLLSPADLEPTLDAVADGRTALAPSSDGGTSLVAGTPSFAYGPGSFHRHLALLRHTDPLVVVRTGLLLDLDDPADLAVARRHPRGRWLDDLLA